MSAEAARNEGKQEPRATHDVQAESSRWWRLADRLLLVIWVFAALSTMYPRLGRMCHVYGTVFTSYGADLTNPPWVYIVLRKRGRHWLAPLVARTPAWTAGSIFLVGALSELGQKFWRGGPFAGRYDPVDLVCYGIGLLLCCVIDQRETARRSAR